MTARIRQAAQATDQVLRLVGEAMAALTAFEGRVINGYGVLCDWSQARCRLADAFTALREGC